MNWIVDVYGSEEEIKIHGQTIVYILHQDIGHLAFEVEAVFPEMTARDTSKYAAALQQVVIAASLALEKRLITQETAVKIINAISGRLGIEIDAEDELKNTAAAGAKDDENDVFVTPPAAAEAED